MISPFRASEAMLRGMVAPVSTQAGTRDPQRFIIELTWLKWLKQMLVSSIIIMLV